MEEEREGEGLDEMGCQDEYRGKICLIEPSGSQATEVEGVADSSPWNASRQKLRDSGFISWLRRWKQCMILLTGAEVSSGLMPVEFCVQREVCLTSHSRGALDVW
ncbi:hypothetical protein Droror1_Dr00011613 [Drosera rotundifolia]